MWPEGNTPLGSEQDPWWAQQMAILKGKKPKHNWTGQEPPQRLRRENSVFLPPPLSTMRFAITSVDGQQPGYMLLRETAFVSPNSQYSTGQSVPSLAHLCCVQTHELTHKTLQGNPNTPGEQVSGHLHSSQGCCSLCRLKMLKFAPFSPGEAAGTKFPVEGEQLITVLLETQVLI